ncbi:MAG TPA: glycosyltransferase family 39 protein [Aggregatilineales bacterium]|nr:glycosyltransferase family 39 protein [Aggregatilineales bacterium]
MNKSQSISTFLSSDIGLLILLVLARILLQVFTNGQYGFHQDELITLDAARHLAWGYVAYPPVTPFIARVALSLFGPSLIGLRFSAVLAEGMVMLLAGLMIRDLGGSRWAQILGAVAVATTPNSIIQAGLFQYETLDYLCWVLVAFAVIRLLKSENPRWWLGIGAAMGLGMMTKYTIAFLIAGVVAGCLATRNRRYLASPWLWGGAVLAFLIWLPNLLWQVQNHWITLYFLGSIHTRDMLAGKGSTFLIDQIKFNFNPVMLFLVIAGLYYFFFAPTGQRYRMIGWMYVVPFILYVLVQANSYYLAPAYPMLAAGGAVWWEGRLSRMADKRRARLWRRTTWAIFALVAALLLIALLPIAPLGSAGWDRLSKVNVELKAEVGWPELVQQVAKVYNALPDSDKARAGILAGSSGEIGSIALYGPAYGLPRPISGFDSFWQYGYGDPPPQTLIVLGFPTDFLANFQDCTMMAPITTPFNIQNEETANHWAIYVCHNLRQPWPDFWKNFQYFG